MVRVSIVIPTKNSAKYLEKCLRSIQELDFPREDLEVIVVDGGSTDRTVEIARRYGCKILFESRGTIAYARDLGARAASGEFVAFTDSDCVVDRNWIRELLSCFTDERVAAVGGPNLTPEDDSGFGKAVGDVLEFLSKAGARYGFRASRVVEVHHNPTCNVMYRRGVLEEVGGFNHNLVTVDDEELDYRIRKRGYRILFTPRAVVYHYRRGSWRSFARMAYNYGTGRMQAIKLHRDMGRWFHHASMLVALLVISSPLLLALRETRALALPLLAVFALSLVSAAAAISLRTGRNPVRYLLLIVIWVVCYGVGMLRGVTK